MEDRSSDEMAIAPFGRLLDRHLADAYHRFEAGLSKDRSPSTVETSMQVVRQFCHYLRTGKVAARFEQTPWPKGEKDEP